MKPIVPLAAAVGLLSCTLGSLSAQGALAGTWHGTIENYGTHDSNSDRELFIAADGACQWDYAKTKKRRGPDKVDCKIDNEAGTVALTTAGRSKVTLKLTPEGTLKGAFVLNFNAPYSLTMKRGPAP